MEEDKRIGGASELIFKTIISSTTRGRPGQTLPSDDCIIRNSANVAEYFSERAA